MLDSFGPVVEVGKGGVEYWGNKSSWSDCFEVRSPVIGTYGGWNEWAKANEKFLFFRIVFLV